MKTKTLALDLGQVRTMQDEIVPQSFLEGWYVDPATGQRVFFDGETETFYTMAGGVYIPLAYMNPAPKQVAVAPGDRLRITISYKYSGPAITGIKERFVIGIYGTFGFNDAVSGENVRNLPASSTPTSYTGEYVLTIPANVGNDWDDIYCKVYGGSPSVPEALLGYSQALLIVGKDPAISEFAIADFIKV